MKSLFLAAIELPEDTRGTWLDRACAGDTALRGEVESLLASDRDAGSFCETPAAALPGSGFDRRLATGSGLGPYEIQDFIGAGGMGEVYRARDTRDGREVAIKTVTAALAHPAGERRLLHEARHASRLGHPNICAIHEVGEAGGIPFIAMELVDGPTLSALQSQGPLPLAQALRHAIDVAGALDHAHTLGVVHRDLKRSNVVIARDGRAVVLDFGLARRLPDEGAAQSTESLTAAGHGPPGTLSHMPPEVLRGGRADSRADIWALGVLLYELVGGGLPFTGRTPFETSSAILGSDPTPLPRAVPMALRLVIARCLEKDPARRYQRAADVRDALRSVREGRRWRVGARLLGTSRTVVRRVAWTAGALLAIAAMGLLALRPVDAPIGSVVLMPFEHGGAPDDEAYAQEMKEAIAARLGGSSGMRVLSSASLPRGRRDPVAAGRAVGAGAIVTGALHRTRDALRLDLRLLDMSGATRWSQSFARSAPEVLVLQAEAVRALAGRLDADLTPEGRERLTLVPSVRPDVYEAYLKGRYEWNQRTAASLQRAVAQFERAIAIDPAYAPAYAGLADSYNLLGTVMVGSGSPRTYRPRAEAAAIKALQIDPQLPAAHAALGYVRHYSWQWADAEQSFLRAIALNPSAPLPRLWYANLLMSKGRFDEALRQAYTARDLDPLSPIVHTNIGWIQHFGGRIDDAVATLRRAVALDPSYPQARWRLAGALARAGQGEEAMREIERVLRLTNRSPSSLASFADLSARLGHQADARRALAELDAIAARRYVSPGIIPGAYLALGDPETALDWMERAYREGANAAAYFAVEPDLQPLRDHPRYQELLRRVGLSGVKGR